MKKISVAKLAYNTLLIATVIGGCNLIIPRGGEDVTAGASVETTFVEEKVFDGSKAPEEFAIPVGDTSFKSYMDYRKITAEGSDQYNFQQECWTDDTGLRRHQDDYVIALGSYYTSKVGDRFEITLSTGETFTAIVGDFKDDRDTDETNRYTLMGNGSKNIIEFVVDTRYLGEMTKKMGDVSYTEGFKGSVQSITKLR